MQINCPTCGQILDFDMRAAVEPVRCHVCQEALSASDLAIALAGQADVPIVPAAQVSDDEFDDFVLQDSESRSIASENILEATLDFDEPVLDIADVPITPAVQVSDDEFDDFVLQDSESKPIAIESSLEATLDFDEPVLDITDVPITPAVQVSDDEFEDFVLQDSEPKPIASENNLEATLDFDEPVLDIADVPITPAVQVSDDEFDDFVLQDSESKPIAIESSLEATLDFDEPVMDIADVPIAPAVQVSDDEFDDFVLQDSEPKPIASENNLEATLDFDEPVLDQHSLPDEVASEPKFDQWGALPVDSENLGAEVALEPLVEEFDVSEPMAIREDDSPGDDELAATVRMEEQTIEIPQASFDAEPVIEIDESSIANDEESMVAESELDIDDNRVPQEAAAVAYKSSKMVKRRPPASPIKALLGVVGGGLLAIPLAGVGLWAIDKLPEPFNSWLKKAKIQVANRSTANGSLPAALTENGVAPEFGSEQPTPSLAEPSPMMSVEEPIAEDGLAPGVAPEPVTPINPDVSFKPPLTVPSFEPPLMPSLAPTLSPKLLSVLEKANQALRDLKLGSEKEKLRAFYLTGCSIADALPQGAPLPEEVSVYVRGVLDDPNARKFFPNVVQQWWKLKSHPQPGFMALGTINPNGTKLILPPFPDAMEVPLESLDPLPVNKRAILFGRIKETAVGNVVEVTGVHVVN